MPVLKVVVVGLTYLPLPYYLGRASTSATVSGRLMLPVSGSRSPSRPAATESSPNTVDGTA